MVESQPGTVVSFNPSVTLAGFSAASRDRFMFNENQLVLAKIVRPLISYARAYTGNKTTIEKIFGGTGTGALIYDNYKNSDGEYILADDKFYLSDSTGVPVGKVTGVVVGFDTQVSSSIVKFWSTTFIDAGYLSVDYSFDNLTWFSVGVVTWTSLFDDTLEHYPGQPSNQRGEYQYTGTLTTPATARYFRIKSQSIGIVTAFTSTTVTMANTYGFPGDGRIFNVDVSFAGQQTQSSIPYTGKSSTQLTGLSTHNTKVGMAVVLEDELCPNLSNITEVRILQTTEPILEHWNSDGSQAIAVVLEGSQFFDICYDANDNVYYAIYLNQEATQTDPIDPSDDFDEAIPGSAFDPLKWVESTTYPYFLHNTVSGTLDMVTVAGGGLLEGNYGVDGDFVLDIDLNAIFTTNSGTAFCVGSKDFETGNLEMLVGIKGVYRNTATFPGSQLFPGSGIFTAAMVEYSDTIGTAAVLRDFRIKPQAFNFMEPTKVVNYVMLWDDALSQYNVTVSGSARPPARPGVPYDTHTATFTISNVHTPSTGQGFTVQVSCDYRQMYGTSISGISLQLERSGSTGYVRYEDATNSGIQTLMTDIVTENRNRPFIFGHPGSANPNISADNFALTSGTIFFDTPVLSVVALDKDGHLAQVTGVTDSEGFAIKNMDIIRNPAAKYNDYIYPYTAIATNGAAYNSGGELYIKVGETLYKYAKGAVLPLEHEDEQGTQATIVTTGEIPEAAITGFAYNGFSQAGLSYLKYEDALSGVFLKTINTTDMTANAYKAKLDVASINYPFTWNVSDLSTLYYVSGTSLKLYDMNESKAAFVNVSSDKQVLAAGTGETAMVTAQVLNVYGIPKSSKSMTFSVSAGDGAISPAVGCSDVNGEDTTSYTVGSAVGTATITVSVSDIACTP